MIRRASFEVVLTALLLGACAGAGPATPAPATEPAPASAPDKVRASAVDDCTAVPGKEPPEPLRAIYTGLAKEARCQREVYTIMGGVTHFLGVECKHCHLEPDYAADTHNKQVANWMARELVPRLQRRATAAGHDGAVWCRDCHQGKAKILGNPRQRGFAIEWMTTHLVEDLQTSAGKSLKCKQCHQGDLGSPQFRPKLILSELGALAPGGALADEPAPAEAEPEPAPLPDDGGR